MGDAGRCRVIDSIVKDVQEVLVRWLSSLSQLARLCTAQALTPRSHEPMALVFWSLFVLGAPRTALPRFVGFQQTVVSDRGGRPLTVGIWYPTTTKPRSQPLMTFVQTVATNGDLAGDRLLLIVMSHGTGGSLASHYDTGLALAEAGFVAAAITHTADNYLDQSYAGNRIDLLDRPRQMKVLTDFMLTRWKYHARLDASRVGMFGSSLGGFTALVEVGGTPDLNRMATLCATRPAAPECTFVQQRHGDQLQPVAAQPKWTHDARIRAVVVAAPAASYLFGDGGLAGVTVPVQLWRADDDRQAPDAWNSAVVRAELRKPPEEHVIADADHFVFLAPCSDALTRVAPQICRDPPGFDRMKFHVTFNEQVVAFYRRALGQTRVSGVERTQRLESMD